MTKLILATLLLPAFSYGETLMEGRPKDCTYSWSSTIGARTQSVTCQDFDPNYAKNYAGVCVFKDKSWQYGNLTYDKKAGKHKFTAKRVCDIGVTVVPPANTLNIKSPRIGDYLEGKTNLVSLTKGIYTSHLSDNPLKADENPILCYRSESRGVAMNAVSCASEPNDPNYCEFTPTPNKKYAGKWWMQYRAKNKKSPVICLGGVKSSSTADAATEYSEDQLLVKVETKTSSELLSTLPAPEVATIKALGFEIAACSITDNKKSIRVPCLNQATTAFDVWENNPEAVLKSLTAKFENAKGIYSKERSLKNMREDIAQASRSLKNTTSQSYSAELKAKIETLAEKIDNLSAEIADIQKDAREDAEKKIADLKTNNGDLVPRYISHDATAGYCHVEWQPASGFKEGELISSPDGSKNVKGAYVYYKRAASKELEKVYCDSAEIVKKTEVKAAAK